jgi:type I restriction enzyme S subunit
VSDVREMKESGISSYGKVPASWESIKLKNILTLRSIKSGGVGELLSVYLDRGVISYSDSDGQQVHKPSQDMSNYQIVKVGDFVLNNQQAWRGSVGVSRYDGIISPAYFVYDISERCDPAYMNFALRDCCMVQQYETASRGVGTIQRNLFAPWLLESMIVLPDLPEQYAIATFLDGKCSEIDQIAADIQAEIEALEAYRRSVVIETVTKGLNAHAEKKDSGIQWIGQMPAHWKTIRGKYTLKYLQKPVREDDGVITCFRDGEVTLRSNRREDGFTLSDKEIGYQGIDIGDLVVHGMDGFAGAIGISDSRGKASPVLNVLDTDMNKKYVMYYLRSMAYGDVFTALATGIRVRSCDLRWNKLAELFYPIPPRKEQDAIVAHIDEKLKKIAEAIDDKKRQLATLEEYKKSLIFEYVTGKKEVPA